MAEEAPTQATVGAVDPSGQPVQVPANLAAAFWRAQQVGFAKGSRVPVKMADGKVGSVEADELGDALEGGAQIASDDEFQQAAHVERLGGKLGASAAAFVSGIKEEAPNALNALNPALAPVTLGSFAVDRLLGRDRGILEGPSTGLDRAQTEAAQREAPWSHGAGKLAGGLATMAVAPEARVPAALEALVGKAGTGILARGVQAAVGEGVRIIPYAAIDGAEKAAAEYQLSQDPSTAAEKAFAHFGADILGGALAGGAIGTAGGAWAKLAGKGSAEGAAKVIATTAGVEGKGPLAEAYTKLASIGKGPEAADLLKRVGPAAATEEASAFRKLIVNREKATDSIANDFGRAVDDMFQGSAKIRPTLIGETKASEFQKLMPQTEEALEHLAGLVSHVDEGLGKAAAAMEEVQAGSSKAIRGMQTAVQNEVNKAKLAIDAANSPFGTTSRARAAVALDNAKRLLDREISLNLKVSSGISFDQFGNMIAHGAGAHDPMVKQAAMAGYQEVRALADTIRTGLEDGALGKMGAAQADLNAGWTEAIPALKSFRQHVGLQQEIPGEFNAKFDRADPKKLVSWVRNISRESERVTSEQLRGAVDATERMARAVESSGFELSGPDKAALDQMKRGADAFKRTYAAREKQMKDLSEFDRLVEDGQRRRLGGTWGIMANPFLDPASTMLNLARVEDSVARTDSSIKKTVLGWLQGKSAEIKAPKVTHENASETMKNVARAASMAPDELAGKIAAQHDGSERAGEAFRMGLTQAALRGIYFLSSKLPDQAKTDPLEFASKAAKSRGWQASPSEIQKWTSYANAVKDPLSVVTDFRNGTITPQGAEVLQKVYPRLYDSVKMRVVEEMSKTTRDFTRTERVNAAILLGVPTDATMTTKALQATLAMYAAKPQQAPPPPKPKGGAPMAAAMGLDSKTTQLAIGAKK